MEAARRTEKRWKFLRAGGEDVKKYFAGSPFEDEGSKEPEGEEHQVVRPLLRGCTERVLTLPDKRAAWCH
eukprot:3349877-Lingulodinium_polyedra.AAC.1